ncbi:MAG: AAA family ATPase [Solirubrobacteraceae bacterium]
MSALLGREAATDLVRERLLEASRGQGSTLLFVGEPGSGKTTVLAAARELADHAAVLTCRGVEWEAELPYSGLHELLAPLLGDLAALPEPQREALEGALGLAPARDDLQGLNVYAGALSLMIEATRRQPVLVVVDDLQWIDSATMLVLSFVARRLDGETLSLIAASRPGTSLAGLGADPVELGPLDADAVAELARRHLGRALPDAAALDLATASAGNPLAVVETVRHFGEQLHLRGSLLDEPLPVGELIERGFDDRLAALPASAREALDVVAASITSDVATIDAALAQLDLSPQALVDGEVGGALELARGRVAFVHPLLRALVHRQMGRDRLRACHAALAAVTADDSLRAWHAASATISPDEPIAADLESAATRFLDRGGHVGAAQALHRAAELSPDPDVRAQRLSRAARVAHLAGRGQWASDMLDEAAVVAVDPKTRVNIEFQRAIVDSHLVAGHDVGNRLLTLATEAVGVDDDLAVHCLTVAATEGIVSGHPEVTTAAFRRLGGIEVKEGLDPLALGELQASRAVGILLTGVGGTYDEAVAMLRQTGEERLTVDGGLGETGGNHEHVAEALVWIGDFDLSRRLATSVLRTARVRGDMLALVGALWVEGYLRFREGSWNTAGTPLAENIRITELSDLVWQRAVAVAVLAMVQGSRGDRSFADQVPQIEADAARYDFGCIVSYTRSAMGLLELGAGRGAEAAAHMEIARDWMQRAGQREPGMMPWPIDLVDAYLVAGDLGRASVALEELRAQSEISNLGWHVAAVARFDGLMAERDYAEHFERSLALYSTIAAPFDEARARLAYGQRLRRSRKRVEAREQLGAALDLFDALGADPWSQQARREMGASAPTLRRDEAFDPSALTPHEEQIAELVVGGASNKEVAGAMFLSPKTIETHLSRIYRKLGVGSRTQLAARLRDELA